MAITTADFQNGMTIELEGDLYTIVQFQHVKPGKGGAFVRTKLKDARTEAVIDKTFRAGEKVEKVRLEEKAMEYLYHADGLFYFMDTKTYEQSALTEGQLGEAKRYLKENMTATVTSYRGKLVGVELPIFVDLKVTKSDPGVRGDTATGGSKPATLETGAVVQVPLFISEEDTIRIDTRTGQYIERV